MIAVYILIGIIIGGVFTYLYMKGKLKVSDEQVGQAKAQNEKVQQQLETSENENRALRDELTQVKMQLSSVQAQLAAEQKANDEQAQLRKEQFEQQLKTVQEQFSNLANHVLDQTSEKLKSQNSESMENITKPLKDNIQQLHQAIQSTNQETAKSTASLSEQLRSMAQQTEKIDKTATRLTNVMRGANKVQGNWGELILSDILDAQGFKQGINYDLQQSITDDKGNIVTNEDSGKRMIPDVIMHYPNNEDVVIDSKMSIEAYFQYVNTEDEGLKKKYADDLVKSVKTQYGNLAKKDYSKYIQKPRHAIEFVIMFVPNEGALQLALATDPKLWNDAFSKQVFITSQQNLMAILRIIQIAWRQYIQSENQKQVFDLAEELLKRVGDFIKKLDTVGSDIDKLHRDYESVHNKLYSGRQSIVQKANQLKELGVKETAALPIPEAITELPEDLS
ncbi:MAG: DNA recombination protein RmuC [Prevotella sp.]|jgi:DNA recombination protein RmuC|nr:DNA recombination protein RmuC [Prevotella sp.]MCI1281034.1 DNA recombination protein RmuC [Prevotella sp.]